MPRNMCQIEYKKPAITGKLVCYHMNLYRCSADRYMYNFNNACICNYKIKVECYSTGKRLSKKWSNPDIYPIQCHRSHRYLDVCVRERKCDHTETREKSIVSWCVVQIPVKCLHCLKYSDCSRESKSELSRSYGKKSENFFAVHFRFFLRNFLFGVRFRLDLDRLA